MATVTFILGLCGSGKSHHLAKSMTGVKVFDENFVGNPAQHAQLLDELRAGRESWPFGAEAEIAHRVRRQFPRSHRENPVTPRRGYGSGKIRGGAAIHMHCIVVVGGGSQ